MKPRLVGVWAHPGLRIHTSQLGEGVYEVGLLQGDRCIAALLVEGRVDAVRLSRELAFTAVDEGRAGRVEGSKRGARTAAKGRRSSGVGNGATTPSDAGAPRSTQIAIPDSAYVNIRGADADHTGTLASDPMGGRDPTGMD